LGSSNNHNHVVSKKTITVPVGTSNDIYFIIHTTGFCYSP